jgi:hypothetical protein
MSQPPLTAELPTEAQPSPREPRPGRSPGARVAVVLGVGFALLLVAYGVLVLLALLLHQSRTTTSLLPDLPPRLVVDVAGSVRVEAAPPGAPATLEVRRRWTWSEPDFRQTRRGDVLEIHSSCFDLGPLGCSTDVRLRVPASTSLVVSSDGGSVRVSGLRAPAELSSSGGSVTATDVQAATLSMSSSAGSVRGTRLAVPDVEASSDAGSVRLDLTIEPTRVAADSSAGSVRVGVPAGRTAYQVDARSSAGSRTVDVPTDPTGDRTIRVRSSAGSVTVSYR